MHVFAIPSAWTLTMLQFTIWFQNERLFTIWHSMKNEMAHQINMMRSMICYEEQKSVIKMTRLKNLAHLGILFYNFCIPGWSLLVIWKFTFLRKNQLRENLVELWNFCVRKFLSWIKTQVLNLFNSDFWFGYAKIRECKLRMANSTGQKSQNLALTFKFTFKSWNSDLWCVWMYGWFMGSTGLPRTTAKVEVLPA